MSNAAAAQVNDYTLAATEAFSANDDDQQGYKLDSLGTRLIAEFHEAKMKRRETEKRWLQDIRQYRGQYDPEEEAAIPKGRSRAFVRKTRVKVKTIDSRVADLLFPAGSEKNWEIDSTPVPSVSKETLAKIQAVLTQAGGGTPPTLEQLKAAALELAKKAASAMSKVIEDQLVESRYKDASVKAIHSGHLYGTGILKGPLVERRIRTRFVQDGSKWLPRSESYVVPFVENTSIWRFFPDMSATKIDQCRYTYELHRMTKFKLAGLAKNRSFKKTKIVDYIKSNPRGHSTDDYFDTELKQLGDRLAQQGSNDGLYDVMERWGYIDGSDLAEVGVIVPDDKMHESFFANIWLLPNGTVIKAVLQPINGVTWPYHLYYFDKDETSIFGEGLGAIMRDDQKMINAATRMLLDNAALTSGPMLEVMVGLLATTEDASEIHPWKVWLRNNTHPEQQAIRSIQLPNSLDQLSKIAQIFEANADETTAIPRYMSGENPSQGAASTASGMSMLMGAANIVIKDLITSWDEGITRSFLEALYRWNMQFNKNAEIKGDFDVKARGTASLVAKEVRAQALNIFSQSVSNELDAPYIKRDKLLRQRAEANELSDVVKTEDEVKLEQDSEMVKMQQQMQMDLAAAQLSESQGKAAKLMAEAELTKKKIDEMMVGMEHTMSRTVETRVKAAFAALQAGAAATNSPYVAPAGDEILKSSGWIDQNGKPDLSALNGPPVQAAQGTEQLVNKGAGFIQQPREGDPPAEADPAMQTPGPQGPQGMPGGGTVEPPAAVQADTQPQTNIPNLQPQTGEVGANAGIETVRTE